MDPRPFWEHSNHSATSSLPCSLEPVTDPYPKPDEPNPISLISILIFLPNYVQVFLVVSFFLDFLPKPLFISFFDSVCAKRPPLHILLDVITLIKLGEEYKLWTPWLCQFLQPPITSSLLGPNILLSTLFSNILSLRSSLNTRDQISHPRRTTGKIVGLYILIFNFLDSRWEKKGKAIPVTGREGP
jgi:hypothetical protein